MFKFFYSRGRNLTKHLSDDYQLWFSRNYFIINPSHRFNVKHSPSFVVNHFNTCPNFLRQNLENIENFNSSKMIIKKDGSVKKKKKRVGVRIYLLNEKGISASMFLEDAEKLAERQKLDLKRVEEINGIPAYKLVPFSEVLEIQTEKDDKKKEEKIKKVIISSDIKPNDLQIKINHINRFLDKKMKVFVKLGERGSDLNKLNAIYSELQKSMVNHSINKQLSKSGFIVHIVPQKENYDSDKNDDLKK